MDNMGNNKTLMTFGKYRNKPLQDVVNDKNYYTWLMNQSWFHEKPEYKLLIELKMNKVKKIKIDTSKNFFQLLQENICDDLLESIGEYLYTHVNDKNEKYVCNTGRYGFNREEIKNNPKFRERINIAFKHKSNILTALKDENEYRLHTNNIEDISYYFNLGENAYIYGKGLTTDLNDIRGWSNDYKADFMKHKVNMKQLRRTKITFGKYKGASFDGFKDGYCYNNKTDKDDPAWKVQHYKNWLDDNGVNPPNYQYFKYYLQLKKLLHQNYRCCYN